MKGHQKYIWFMLLAGLLTACGSQAADRTPEATEAASNLAAEQAASPAASPEETAEQKEDEAPVPVYPDTLAMNDTMLYQGQFEITMLSSELATRVDPSAPGDFYNYYEVDDPQKVYAHSVFLVKNLSGSAKPADSFFDITLTYDGQYEYTGFSAIEEDGGSDFTYTSITSVAPLTSAKIHMLVEVPKEVQDSGKPLVYTVKAGGHQVTVTEEAGTGERWVMAEEQPVADLSDWRELKPLTKDVAVTSGEYAEITVKEAQLTTTVKPSNPGSFHSYYEVKDPGKIYGHLAVSFKNLMPIGKAADEALQVRLIYDDKFEYRGFSAIEESGGGDLTYTSITKIDPLMTEQLHYIFEMPAEAQDSGKPIVFIVRADDTEYAFEMRQ